LGSELLEGFAVCFRDIRHRKQLEDVRQTLAEAASIFTLSLDFETQLQAVARVTIPKLADMCVVYLADRSDCVRRVAVAHRDPALEVLLWRLEQEYPFDRYGPEGAPRVIRTGTAVFHPEVSDEMIRSKALDPQHLEILRTLSPRSIVAVPLNVRGRTLGAIVLAMSASGRRFSRYDLEATEDLASRAAICLDNARLYRQAQEEIAERSRAEQALKNITQRLMLAQHVSRLGTFERSVKTDVEVWSPELERLYGLEAGSFGRTFEDWLSRIHPDDRARVEASVNKMLTDPSGSFDTEFRITWPDGSIHWMAARGHLFQDEKGEPDHVIGINMDITDRRIAEEASRQSEARFRTLAENIPQLVWSARPDGSVDYASYQWHEYTGLNIEASLDNGWLSAFHPADIRRVSANWQRCVETGEPYEDEIRLRGRDGSYRWFLDRGLPLRDASGQIVKWIGTCTDIQQKKDAEDSLLKAEKLAAAGRLAATVAHEINNPLEGAINLVYLARCTPALSPNLEALLQSAEEQLARVAHCARQTLGFYREFSATSFVQLPELMDDILQLCSVRLVAKKISVDRQYRTATPVVGMPGELRQLFSNLVVNALDASPTGGRLIVRIAEANLWRNTPVRGVRVTIADQGEGISRDNTLKIFEPFFTTKRDVGTGLGLWVSREIVERHRGSIRFRSSAVPGRSGTVFSVILPIAAESLSSSALAEAACKLQ
jgi:PAS domain S-box-containing protein